MNISLLVTDGSVKGHWCEEKSEYAERTHVSHRATAIPYHKQTR